MLPESSASCHDSGRNWKGLTFLPGNQLSATIPYVITFTCGLLLVPCLKFAFARMSRGRLGGKHVRDEPSVYDLDHGRLHIQLPQPMWMNMGYWHNPEKDAVLRYPSHFKNSDSDPEPDPEDIYPDPHTLAIACRTLLSEVLHEAGFSRKRDSSQIQLGTRKTKALIDLGFGCGDQTMYLKSQTWLRPCDEQWWDYQSYVGLFDHYIGITQDRKQYKYAQGRVEELKQYHWRNPERIREATAKNTYLYCANAANTESWGQVVDEKVFEAYKQVDERWVLGLDSLYHFSPSRWGVIANARALDASFMAFDLCLSENISFSQRLLLRTLTTLMGAPWANFVTKAEYKRKLEDAGYEDLKMKDISEHVFGPLAAFLERQNEVLGAIGFGLGSFHVARWMFGWWGRSGVVRGVIVVATNLKGDVR